ncbi:MAG: hypothetical protein FWC45_01030, partial [Treponema sp.]|nr:hypothetical protein [Treponema sp.]
MRGIKNIILFTLFFITSFSYAMPSRQSTSAPPPSTQPPAPVTILSRAESDPYTDSLAGKPLPG